MRTEAGLSMSHDMKAMRLTWAGHVANNEYFNRWKENTWEAKHR